LHEAQSKSTLLFRPLHCPDLERGNCLKGATYIYSQWEGYWEKDSYNRLKEWLERNAIPKISIHTSGHASPGDFKENRDSNQSAQGGSNPHLFPERYSELFQNVEVHNDGEWWEV